MAGWLRIALVELDLGILFATFGLTGVATLIFGKRVPSRPRPFYLVDHTLWHEWRKTDTVPIWTVFVAGYVVLSALIYFGEYRLAVRVRRTTRARARRTALRFALGVWTGTMLSVCLTEWSKGYVGRLRPNFVERCFGQPVADVLGLPDARSGAPVAEERCVGTGAADGRRSFPSGHSALAAGIGAYAHLWAGRVPGTQAYAVGLLAMAAAFWVCASRIVDSAHHVSDVVGGALLGIWMAAVHFWMVERETAAAERRDAAVDCPKSE